MSEDDAGATRAFIVAVSPGSVAGWRGLGCRDHTARLRAQPERWADEFGPPRALGLRVVAMKHVFVPHVRTMVT